MEVKTEVDADEYAEEEEDFKENGEDGSSSDSEDLSELDDELSEKDESKVKMESGNPSTEPPQRRRWKGRSHLKKLCGKLPPGWRQTWHSSGIVVYFHHDTNTCTLSRPFLVGGGGVKLNVPFKKEVAQTMIPNWAIPCLHYQKQKTMFNFDSVKGTTCPVPMDQISEVKREPEEIDSAELENNCENQEEQQQNMESCNPVEVGGEQLTFNFIMAQKICKVCSGFITKYGKNSGRPVGGEDSYPVYENFMTKKKPGVEISRDDEVHDRCQIQIRRFAGKLPERPPAKNPRKATSTSKSGSKRPHDDSQPSDECLKIPKMESSDPATTSADAIVDNAQEFVCYRPKEEDLKDMKENKLAIKPGMKLVLNTLLTPDEIHDYCTKLFKFHRTLKKTNGNGKLEAMKRSREKRGFNATEILSKLAESEFKKQVVYEINKIFSYNNRMLDIWKCIVYIDGGECGVGYGTGKEEAKNNASRFTIKILFPQELENETQSKPHPLFPELFKDVDLHDENILKLCGKIHERSPLLMLLRYIFMKHGTNASNFIIMKKINNGKNDQSFRLTYVKHHEVELRAKGNAIAKNVAAQIILTKLHPEVTDFSQFVTMYGANGFSEYLKNMSK